MARGRPTDTGTAGDDELRGSPRADALNGLAGDDTIRAGSGDDAILGNGVEGGFGGNPLAGPGDNLIFAQSGDDTISAGYQADSVYGGRGRDSIYGAGVSGGGGGAGNLLQTRDLGDLLHGGRGDDSIDGVGGDDTLRGGQGDDTLIGSFRRDELTGGPGGDLFVFAYRGGTGVSESDTGTDQATRDVITDFEQGKDRIDLSSYRLRVGSDAEALFLGQREFREQEPALQVRYDAEDGRTVIQIYVPFAFGLPPTVYEIELRGEQALRAQDFVFYDPIL